MATTPRATATATTSSNNKNIDFDTNYQTTGSFFGKSRDIQDVILRDSGRSGISNGVAANLYGFDHRNMGYHLARNKEQYGYVFFTRPRLRLSYDNLKMDRIFKLLDNKDAYSVYRWVRNVLDPVVRNGANSYSPSPLVDPLNVFMPLLSNSLVSLSGWPEITVDTYTSSEGYRKEQWSMADGYAKHYSSFNITCEFENMVNNYIPELMWFWTQYQLLVHEGIFVPHLDSVLENEIDYQTRIYRLIMDQTKTYVIDIAATGIAFPTSPAQASRYDYNRDEVFNKSNDTFSIPFQCSGAIYKDPILLAEFNLAVQAFNLGMHDSVREKSYVKLKPNETTLFNRFGYPRINLETGMLEWWVPKNQYNIILKAQGLVKQGA